jgi:alkanesulfonate monooxygenase SsuD/methylene tetrahydromethanopterin reductase-like flavin-dependent oxidoreductase (luciferase family)
MSSLDIMRHAWRGAPVNSGTLSPWPGCEAGPPVLLGAWRNPRWIAYAAKQCQGWVASGLYSSWEDLENGMRLYREAGGTTPSSPMWLSIFAIGPNQGASPSAPRCRSSVCPTTRVSG